MIWKRNFRPQPRRRDSWRPDVSVRGCEWDTLLMQVDGDRHLPQRGENLRGHDRPIHGSCAIYFPGGIYIYINPVSKKNMWKSIFC